MGVLIMVRKHVNPLIWRKVEKCHTNENVINFIKEILLFEREHLDKIKSLFSEEYDKLIEKYSKYIGEDI